MKNVVILGASGTVGKALIPALLDSEFNVTVVTRPTSTTAFNEAVTAVQCDYKDLDKLVEVFRGQDVIVSAVAPFGIPDQRNAIDAAIKAGVQRFIPSEYGLDTSLPDVGEVAPFAINKQKIAHYLQSKEREGLSWTAICSGAFFPWQLELGSGKMGWDIANHRVTLWDKGTQPYEASTLAQVVRGIVSVLQHPTETENQYVYIKSFSLTQRRVLDSLIRHSGKEYHVSHGSAEESARQGFELIEKGDLQNGYPKITTAVTYGNYGFVTFAEKAKKWMAVLGLQDEEDRFEDVVAECLERMK